MEDAAAASVLAGSPEERKGRFSNYANLMTNLESPTVPDVDEPVLVRRDSDEEMEVSEAFDVQFLLKETKRAKRKRLKRVMDRLSRLASQSTHWSSFGDPAVLKENDTSGTASGDFDLTLLFPFVKHADEEVRRDALGTLAYLTYCPEFRMVLCGQVSLFISSLKSKHDVIKGFGALGIGNLCFDVDIAARLVKEERITEVLFELCTKTNNMEVQKYTLRAFEILCSRIGPVRLRLVELGVLSSVMKVAKTSVRIFSTTKSQTQRALASELQQYCCAMLANVAYQNEAMQEQIFEAGGVRIIMSMVKSSREDIKGAALKCLTYVMEMRQFREKVIEQQGVETLCIHLRNANPEIKAWSAYGLAMLSLSALACIRMDSMHSIEDLLSLLENSGDNNDMLKFTLAALGNIAGYPPYRGRVYDAGLLQDVINLIAHEDPDISQQALRALRNMYVHIPSRDYMDEKHLTKKMKEQEKKPRFLMRPM